ncbi:MAG TPA: hypothetical protein VFW23_17085, partial [Tepidisphaeraceae bacterium]|nr:hypothetical protein [Tepidisphaeraceae bacterium]
GIIRLNVDGSVDTTFNPAGVVDTWAANTAGQSDGKYLKLDSSGVITRYNTDGSIDTTFGNNGHVSSYLTNSSYGKFIPACIAMQSNQILVGGQATDPSTVPTQDNGFTEGAFAMERLNSNGSPDTSFGLQTAFDDFEDMATIGRIRVDQAGNILVAGSSDSATFFAKWSGPGLQGLSSVTSFGDMVVDSQGNVTVACQQSEGESPILITFNENINIRNQGAVYQTNGVHPLNLPGLNKSSPSPGSVASLALAPDGRLVASTSYVKSIFRVLTASSPAPAGLIEGTATFPAMSNYPVPAPSAQIYLDLNNNGQLDSGEPSMFTYGGYYEFANLAPGTYHVRAITPAGMVPAASTNSSNTDGYTVTVGSSAGSRGDDFVFATSQSGTLSGYVSIQQDNAGHTSPGGLTLSNVAVYVDLNNNGVHDANEPETTTDAGGNYTLPISKPGDYIVRVDDQAASPAGTYQAAQANGVQATATVSQLPNLPGVGGIVPPLFIDVPLLPSYIEGSVYLDANQNGVLDAGDTPLGDQTVYLDLNGNGKFDAADEPASASNPGAGGWVIQVPGPGTYSVLLAPFEDVLQQIVPANGSGFTVTITAAQGQAQTNFNFLLTSAPTSKPPARAGSKPVTQLSPAEQLAADQSALESDIVARVQQLRAQRNVIHQDARALSSDIRNLQVLRRQLRAGSASAGELSAAQAKVAADRQVLATDRASLKTLASSTQGAIVTVRHALQVDHKAARNSSKHNG